MLIYFFTERVNVFAGLNAGMLCSGIIIVVFFEMLRAVFCALFFTMKLPNPRRYTFSSFDNDVFTEFINASSVVSTVCLSMPVFLAISFTISALVIALIIIVIRYLNFLDCKYIAFLAHGEISCEQILEKVFFAFSKPVFLQDFTCF